MDAPRFNRPVLFSSARAFSLVEVVLAVGIFAFVGVALIGLFSIGLKTNRESVEELEATSVAQSFLSTRRAAPTNPLPDCPLPVLNQPAETASALFLTSQGMVTNSPAGARFGFLYRIRPDTNAGSVSLVYLCLYWPAAAKPESAAGKCEMISTIKLP